MITGAWKRIAVGLCAASLIAALAIAASAIAGSIAYLNFANTTGLKLNKQATAVGPRIQLTEDGTFDKRGSFFTERKFLRTGRSFNATFSFEITSKGDPADGLTFVVQSGKAKAIGAAGVGLATRASRRASPSVSTPSSMMSSPCSSTAKLSIRSVESPQTQAWSAEFATAGSTTTRRPTRSTSTTRTLRKSLRTRSSKVIRICRSWARRRASASPLPRAASTPPTRSSTSSSVRTCKRLEPLRRQDRRDLPWEVGHEALGELTGGS